MPAPTLVTDEEILNAGALLVAAGRAVTGGALRVLTGHGEEKRLMKVWEQAQKSGAAPGQQATSCAPLPMLPPELADKAEAFVTQMTEQYQAAIVGAWTMAERRAAARLGEEVTAAQAAAAAARLAQGEADEAVAAADSTMAALRAERDRLVQAIDAMAMAEARAVGERDALAGQLVTARREVTAAERRAAAAETACEAARVAVSMAHAESKAATAAATAIREQIAAEVATARAEAIAAEAAAEAIRRAAAADALEWKARIAELQQALTQVHERRQPTARTPSRQGRLAGETRSAASSDSGDTPVVQPSALALEELPIVADRLKLPKSARAAYDEGFAAGRNGWDEKVPRRFQPGQRLADLLHYRRAGYRDGTAAQQRQTALPAKPASTARDAPSQGEETPSA